MTHLIDKDALVAEIEKEIKRIYAGREYVGIPSNEENMVRGLQKAEDIINILEVKEVDLEKELSTYLEVVKATDEDIDFVDFAKHFFELGIKVRQ